MASHEASLDAAKIGGLGKLIKIIYVILALAATGRSVYQIISKFEEAPLAYSLSAVAAVVYVLITVALFQRGRVWRNIARAGAIFEIIGVVTVGTLSLLMPEFFAHPAVWSHFGSGYLFLPVIMPILGLNYLAKLDRLERADA
ncbi:hypothetical protein [Canibacter zhoujuaniae]|uniref:hypothetical protein n=1 Tax=Canibacter zhoujuaniae TaxID=2708343 RepID=UPI001420FFF6|nr:hypothetical protein [Canibacter zhoujuaniae]